jgi:hypothetical protein
MLLSIAYFPVDPHARKRGHLLPVVSFARSMTEVHEVEPTHSLIPFNLNKVHPQIALQITTFVSITTRFIDTQMTDVDESLGMVKELAMTSPMRIREHVYKRCVLSQKKRDELP